MLLSQTAHYALRAVYFLISSGDDKWHLTKDVAEVTKIPAPYLARIMSTLAKKGILRSRTGMGGGFCISKEGLKYSLYDIVSQFDNIDSIPDCMFGFVNCAGEDHLELHAQWHELKQKLVDILRNSSLGDIKEKYQNFDWEKIEIE
jgi:Rrf2 family transcriptional regulator, nitric oxide-sensitive transcriptional repressor